MARPLPASPRARRLRWLLLGVLCSAGAALLVTGGTLLLPGGVARSLSGGAAQAGLVLGGTLLLGSAVVVRARRGRARPPR
ncbi:hypothetical protein ABZ508_12280 [Streptomyces lavendulocolor]|jgi:hypothetical protein|uniref:Uncharacterized protein n=1 Tax=Streptomyces lavendulocolor TaxID=67316 RepID=A0ABV2W3M0_9ACTN